MNVAKFVGVCNAKVHMYMLHIFIYVFIYCIVHVIFFMWDSNLFQY